MHRNLSTFRVLHTDEEIYAAGLEDGASTRRTPPNRLKTTAGGMSIIHHELYKLGYEEGQADRERFSYIRPVDDEYYEVNAAPAGWEWTREKRTPEPGDFYLSKNGNAIECTKVRGNNQKRHILRRK